MDTEQQALVNQCSIHQLEYVAIDINPQSQVRFLCLSCLISIGKKSSIKSLNDAQIYLDGIKSVFMERKQDESKKNSQTLKDLTSSIQQLKLFYNQGLDKILGNIQQQEAIIQQEQEDLIKKLQSMDLQCYFTQSYQFNNKSNELKNILETQILKLNNSDLIQQCLQHLESIEDPISFDEQQSNENLQTHYIPLKCETHKKKIIGFHLDNQKAKENRICCVICMENKQGQFTSLDTAFEQWKVYEQQKKEQLSQQLNNDRQKVETIQLQLKQILSSFEQKINETNNQLQSKLIVKENQNQKELDQLNKNWHQLSKEDILQIADILIQNERNNEEEDTKVDQQIILIIDDSLKFLKDAVIEFNNYINRLHQEKKYNELNSELLSENSRLKTLNVYNCIISEDLQKKQITQQTQTVTLQKNNQIVDQNFLGSNNTKIEQLNEQILLCVMQNDKKLEQLNQQIESFSQNLLIQRDQEEQIKQFKLQLTSHQIQIEIEKERWKKQQELLEEKEQSQSQLLSESIKQIQDKYNDENKNQIKLFQELEIKSSKQEEKLQTYQKQIDLLNIELNQNKEKNRQNKRFSFKNIFKIQQCYDSQELILQL